MVVGGGRVATRRVADLVAVSADVVVVALELTADLEKRVAAGQIAALRRPFEPGDLDGAWLAFTATADLAVDRAVVAAAGERRCWVSSAQGGAGASCAPMSVLRRGDLHVAVGTSGRSPALAGWLRRRLESQVGPEYGVLLDLAAEARQDLSGSGAGGDGYNWYRAFDSGILDLIRAGRVSEAREGLRTCLSSS